MSRNLILTPYEHGFMAALNEIYNNGPLSDKDNVIDIPHLLLSALTMSGVDTISSIGSIQNSQTKLIKKIASKASITKWHNVYKKTDGAFEVLKDNLSDKNAKGELDDIKHKISQMLFALKTNSGIITFSNFSEVKHRDKLPLELVIPLKILTESMQVKTANLPIIKYETEKKDIRKFIDILESKEFYSYKEAQSEIELNQNLTNKTIRSIEKAGKELYNRNVLELNIRENVLKAIPMTSKIVELFFGKLPGILADFSGSLVSDYLKINKSIPIYYCEPILKELHQVRLNYKILQFLESKKNEIQRL